MSFLPITTSTKLRFVKASLMPMIRSFIINCVFLLVLERKSYASTPSYLRTVPKLLTTDGPGAAGADG